jgi:hypothetical protein
LGGGRFVEASLPEAQGATLAAHWLGKIIPKSGEKRKLSARRTECLFIDLSGVEGRDVGGESVHQVECADYL